MQVGLLTAFFGGVLALLSPCGALLLPAFFAATTGTKARLLAHGAVFYLGLSVTLVPFGLGLGAMGSLMTTQRGLIIALTSILLVVLGAAQMFGLGFDLARVLPGAAAMRQHAATRATGFLRTFMMGAASGVAGFCAGPILGAILTLAVARGDAWDAGALLAVYAAGMVVPLLVIAALWQRMTATGRSALRGRTFTLLGRDLHSTSVLTGGLIMVVGVVFWLTNGLVGMPTLIPTDVQTWMQDGTSVLAAPGYDVVAILLLAGTAVAAWAIARRRRSEPASGDSCDATAQSHFRRSAVSKSHLNS